MMRVRRFRNAPAAVAIASLAIGVGGNVTVYSVVREMVFDDLSATHPERLVRFGANLSYTGYRELAASGVFEDVAFYRSFSRPNWRTGDHSEMTWAIEASPNFFETLGVPAAPLAQGSVVASYAFWKRRLGGDPAAIGRSIELNGRLYSIASVLPEDYRSVYGMSISPEIYLPAEITRPADASWTAFGRLHDGQSMAAARQATATLAERLWGAESARQFALLRPMAGLAAHPDSGVSIFFVALFAVAGMMALIACANVAGLLTARGLSRRREWALRKALGASRWQVMRPLLAEAAGLAIAGAAAGLLLEWLLASRLRLVRFPSAYGVPFEFHFHGDAGLLVYAAGAALVALAVSALGPALSASNVDLGLALKRAEPAFSPRRWNARSVFVAVQMALAVMLLAVGALFVRSFVHVATSDPGFDAPRLVIAGTQPAPGTPQDYRQRLVQRLEEAPGVLSVTSSAILPLAGELPKVRLETREVYSVEVGARYFETMGIRMLRGRDFRQGDRGVAIVNRTLARQLFGEGEAVGRRLSKERGELIVGVAADSRLRTLGEENVAAVYLPSTFGAVLVRVAGDAERWIGPVRKAMAEVDSRAALDVRPLEDAVAGGLFPIRMAALLVGSLSAAGLLLALVGLYAAVAHSVARRTREMGIRAALGATRARILWTALSDGMEVLALGGAVGLAAAVFAIRPLVGIVPDGVNPWSPMQFAGVFALLLAAGAAAAIGPARRAARVDAAIALRED